MKTLAAPHPERSEQDLIRALQDTVSASRLSLFLQCRLKFYFRYVLKMQKPKTASLHLGSAVHAVLKAWNKARWLQQPLTLKQVHETYLGAWADTTEGPVSWEPGEEDADKTTGWRLCDTYLREHHVPAEIKPDAVEVSIEADLREHGLPKLIGILDLVQQGCIIDYKTTSSTPHAEKVAHTTETQTSSYAILFRHNTGTQEAGMQLHHLVKLKNPKVVITPLPPMSRDQQTRLFRQMEAYLRGLQHPDFIPSPGMHCSSCEFFNECRRPVLHPRAPAGLPSLHPLMKHLFLFTTCLLLFTPNLRAGWFFDDPPPPPPDLGPEYRAKISSLEDRISEQHATTTRWEIATGTFALGSVLLFVIGTALGAKTRQHHDGTARLGRTVPHTPAPPAPNGARHHMGEAGPPDRHSTLAA